MSILTHLGRVLFVAFVGSLLPGPVDGSITTTDTQPADVLLNNGILMPKVGTGVDHLTSVADTKANTLLALQGGVRRFFTSNINGFLAGVGQAVRETAVSRKDIFIIGTTYDDQTHCFGYKECYDQTAALLKTNLALLQMDYVDMWMQDEALPTDCPSIQGYWQAFEDSYARSEARSIAISNSDRDQISCILSMSGTKPALNQLSFSVGYPNPMIATNSMLGIGTDSFHGLGLKYEALADPDILSIGRKYNKTAAQVAFHWILQQNVTFQTTGKDIHHFRQDVDIFDFTLSAAEMTLLDNKRYVSQGPMPKECKAGVPEGYRFENEHATKAEMIGRVTCADGYDPSTISNPVVSCETEGATFTATGCVRLMPTSSEYV